MIKSIQKQLDVSLVSTALTFALIYCLMFNTSVVLYKYEYYQVSFVSAVFELLKQFIYTYIATFIFFFGLAIHRLIFIIGSIFLFFTGAIASYYLFYLGVAPTEKMMPAIYGTEISEISELISTRVIIWIIFSLSICIFGIKHFNPQTTKSFFSRMLTALCLFVAINNIISPQFKILKSYFPLQYLHNSYVYFFGNKGHVRQDISQNIDKVKSETGFLSVLTALSYDTTWISTQSISGYYESTSTLYDEVKFSIIPGGSLLYSMNSHDGLMLPYIEKLLEKQGRQFITVQLSGSHWNYASRYPEEFTKFNPTQKKNAKIDQASCTKEELINSYDNSILYTDFFLANLIDLLKNKNAFLIFASDHGESLGENGRLGHGSEFAPEQKEIPFMVWFSDSFKKNYPELVNAVNSHKGQIISHDYIFHSVLHCLGIESEILDLNYSLCNSKKDKN